MLLRSPLFVPALRTEWAATVATLEADAIVLDLEDSIAASYKEAGRAALETLWANALPRHNAIVRINGVRTSGRHTGPWRQDVAAAVRSLSPAALMIPKVESRAEIAAVATEVDRWLVAGQRAPELLVLIETTLGLARAEEILSRARDLRVIAVAYGTEDMVCELGVERAYTFNSPLHATALVRLAGIARRAGINLLDGVFPYIDGPKAADDLLRRECELARSLGGSGKLVVHPKQLPVVNSAFQIPPAALEDAVARVEEVAAKARTSGLSTVVWDGMLVDTPEFRRTSALLKRGEACGLDVTSLRTRFRQARAAFFGEVPAEEGQERF